MGLMSKIEDKLSGNKNNTTEEKLQHEGVDSSRQHGTFTGEGSHLQSGTSTTGTSNVPTSRGVHGTTGAYGDNISGTTPTSNVGGTHSGSGITGSHTGNYGPGSSTTGTTSGITGGTHPLVTGENNYSGSQGTGGLTGSTVGGTHTGTHHGSHTGSHVPGTHNTHTTSHTGTAVGSGITGGTAVGSHTGHHTGNSTLGSSHRAEAGDVGSRDYVSGDSSVGQGTHHSSARNPVDPYSSKGQRAMADAAEGRHHNKATQDTDFVPGSHPAAQNPSAIPTAGGERVGGGNTYDDTRTHDNRSGMEKIKDKVIPSRTDRPDDPVTGQNYSQETRGSHTTTGSHIPGTSTSHNTTTGSHGLTGHHNQTTSADTPLAHDSGFNQRHTTAGAGLAGAGAGAGLASAGYHNSHEHQQYAAGQQAAHDQYGSGNTSGIVDNRSGMEKIKDKVIPSRTDRPDDLTTGQNYGQGVSSSQQYTGTAGSHLPGSTQHAGQGSHFSQESGTGGHHTYGSGANDGGVGGVTQGVSHVGLGGDSSSHAGKLGGAYEAGYNDAVKHLRSEQGR